MTHTTTSTHTFTFTDVLGTINKALVTVPAALIGLLLLFGVDASGPITVVAGILLTLTPIIAYIVKNAGQVDAPYANKSLITIGAAVTGLCMLAGIDVSREVEQAVAALTTLTPLLVFLIHNAPAKPRIGRANY